MIQRIRSILIGQVGAASTRPPNKVECCFTAPANRWRKRVAENIRRIGQDGDFPDLSTAWAIEAVRRGYAENFTLLGRPIIQVPQDIYAVQELVWACRPDLIVETGRTHGDR